MGDAKAHAAKDAKEEKPAAQLGSAAASTDPTVQRLLAERAAAVLNNDYDAIADINAKLADLGVN